MICGQPFFVVVDYAHTDDALENLIRTARELNPKGRIITLFGCGGWKDRTKRPVMGEVAGRLSDLTILANDNPQTEDPLKIISDIVVGLQKANGKYLIEPDREKAIALAIDEARAGDIVLLAGKGHENYQILADRTMEFDDREEARRALRSAVYERAPRSGRGSGRQRVWHLARFGRAQVARRCECATSASIVTIRHGGALKTVNTTDRSVWYFA